MKIAPSILLIVFLLLACAPPEQATPTPTEPAKIAITHIGVLPTKTQAPTPTILPSLTPDLSTITSDPEIFLLKIEDLPFVGEYYLPNNGLSPVRNSEVIQVLRTEKGEKFIQETGRLDGWVVTYERGTSVKTIPKAITDKVSMFETIEGAQLSIDFEVDNLSSNFREVLSPVTLGDYSRAYSYSRNNSVDFVYYFSFRNYVHVLEFRGTENEVTLNFVEQIANQLLDKLVLTQLTNYE